MSAPTETAASAATAPAATTAAVEELGPVADGLRVYVGNLAFNATEEQVREHFAKVGGEIDSVILPTRYKSLRPAGYAFVTYKTVEDAKNAVEKLNETEIGERKIQLELARSKEENEQRKTEILTKRRETQATKAADKAADGEKSDKAGDKADKPKKKKAAKPKAGRRRGPEDGDEAAVDGTTEDAASSTKSKTPKAKGRIDATEGDAPESKPKAPKAPKERKPRLELTGEVSKTTVFVANLPFTVDDEALAALFTDLSIKVKSAHVIRGLRRLPGRRPFLGSKGFGFVELDDESQQQEAVDKINNTAIGERTITAKVAQEMKPIEDADEKDSKTDAPSKAPAAEPEATPAVAAA